MYPMYNWPKDAYTVDLIPLYFSSTNTKFPLKKARKKKAFNQFPFIERKNIVSVSFPGCPICSSLKCLLAKTSWIRAILILGHQSSGIARINISHTQA